MAFDITIVGYLAGTCTAIAQFPQAYKVYKTKETHSISLGMYSILTLSIALWFTYGFLLPDLPMILANGICLIPSIYTLSVAINNSRKSKKR
ncbi:SemiSWEET transporter [Paludibacteraceae bacterium OttesenSCG-928-F17]|nr:SemiSWEET transporter [Paludibacteraceae bacterium OttesenSCG-928-F17]